MLQQAYRYLLLIAQLQDALWRELAAEHSRSNGDETDSADDLVCVEGYDSDQTVELEWQCIDT